MPSRSSLAYGLAVALVLFAGIFLRLYPSATFRRPGFDEVLYRAYVQGLEIGGLGEYDTITAGYIARQRLPQTQAELPPTRFLYIFAGYLWKRAEFGAAPPVNLREPGSFDRDPILLSLRHVSACFSIFLLGLSGLAALRWAGREAGLGVLALMAFAPLQIHMSQHALIDGFFAFWAALCLWTLWESLQHPNHPGWLIAFGVSSMLLVLTKENAFFVYVGLAALTGASRWTRFGRVTPSLLAVGILGPLLGLVTLMNLAGGPANFIETYRVLVTKAEHLDYAILTGDGPWYRYLVDLMLMNPLLLCLAIGGAFCVTRENRAYLYLLGFVSVTYLIMCNIRYGMNLRYATIWDLPFCALAFAQLSWLTRPLAARRELILALAVAALCVNELCQYRVFFMEGSLYELASEGLLRSVHILKEATP